MSGAAPKLEPLVLCFALSQGDNGASLQVLHGNLTLNLGTHPHHYCLITLARRRLSDAARGVRPAEQGWLTRDALNILLPFGDNAANVLIFRARHQWLAQFPNLGELIERRRNAFRLASLPFEIECDGVMQARYSEAVYTDRSVVT